ncbi:MAG: glycosyltransferase family 4 protein [Kiritimatiellae bacterium]|nr:glycosyltransferase family 4 protein [Kiritimatiellia bacterium]
MKVCIDIQAAIAQRAGVGRYTKALVEHLGALAGDDDLALFYFDFQRKGTPFPVSGARQKAVRWCPGRVVQKAWKEIHWPPFDWFAGAADVYHFPNFILPPLTRGRSVVTIHDTSFLRHPETTEEKNLRYLTAKIRDTVARADAIITDSVFSAMEVEELLKAPREKLHPILLGLSAGLRRPDHEAIRAFRGRHGLERPYLLMVGTLEPRKNVPFLVEVFEKLGGFDGDLVIAGMRGWKYEPILQRIEVSPRRDRIRYLEYVREEDLPALYAGAQLFVFPSFYEGFGFPPLEAMACGTPVVASAAGSLPEVLGGAAELVEGFDADEWTARVGALLADRARCEQLRARGLEQAKKFRWEETARKTWNVYREVHGR